MDADASREDTLPTLDRWLADLKRRFRQARIDKHMAAGFSDDDFVAHYGKITDAILQTEFAWLDRQFIEAHRVGQYHTAAYALVASEIAWLREQLDAQRESADDPSELTRRFVKALGARGRAELERALSKTRRAGERPERVPRPNRRTANEIVANYYRARGQSPELKLSDYLRQIGESHREGYIRNAKVGYDTLHKRGKIG